MVQFQAKRHGNHGLLGACVVLCSLEFGGGIIPVVERERDIYISRSIGKGSTRTMETNATVITRAPGLLYLLWYSDYTLAISVPC